MPGDLTFGPGSNRPATRPSTGNVEDFLGIHQRPGAGGATTLPATRPGQGGGGIQRPTPLPGHGDFRPGIAKPGTPGTRPGQGGAGERWPDLRPGGGGTKPIRPDRPVNIGDITNIGNRPSWSHIGDNNINVINNKWNTAINRPTMNNWIGNHPGRWDHWNNWGNGIANRWPGYNHGWFNNNWWHNHPCNHCWWHYHGYWGYRPWSYWWRYPSWGQVCTWFPSYGWNNNATYYDYGTGGNVVYQDNSVYIDGQAVATQEQFAQSAAALATVNYPTEPDPAAAAKMDWLPLGTFAISTSENDKSTSKTIQLAVNQDGIVTGTMYNETTDKTYAVQGKVDKETQRVAFTIGANNNVIMETGIFNLTQDVAPALVHHGESQTDTYLLVRLPAPEEESSGSDVDPLK